jgi:DnaJ-class molecular chaperone
MPARLAAAPERLRVNLNYRPKPAMRFCPKCSGHKQVACEKCDGAGEKKKAGPEGEVKFEPCRECGGSGWVDCPRCSEPDGSDGDTDLDQLGRGDSMF